MKGLLSIRMCWEVNHRAYCEQKKSEPCVKRLRVVFNVAVKCCR